MVKDDSVSHNVNHSQRERENAVKSKGSVKSPRAVNVKSRNEETRTSNPGRKTVKSPGMKVAGATSRNSDQLKKSIKSQNRPSTGRISLVSGSSKTKIGKVDE